MDNQDAKTCSICQGTYTNFGNNAYPVNDGLCCDECNVLVVVPARIMRFHQLRDMDKRRKN